MMKKGILLSAILLTLVACMGTESDGADGPGSQEIKDSILVILDSNGVDITNLDEDLLDSLVAEYDDYDFDEDELLALFEIEDNSNQKPTDPVVDPNTNPNDSNALDSLDEDPIDPGMDFSMDSAAIKQMKSDLSGSWVKTEQVLIPITESSYQQDPTLGFIEIKDTVGYDTLNNTLEYTFMDDSLTVTKTTDDKYFPIVESLSGAYTIEDGIILLETQSSFWAPTHVMAYKVGETNAGSIELIKAYTGYVPVEEDTTSVDPADSTNTSDTTSTEVINPQDSTNRGKTQPAPLGLQNEWLSSRVVFENQRAVDQEGMIIIDGTELNIYYTSVSDTLWEVQSAYSKLSDYELSVDTYQEQSNVIMNYQLLDHRVVIYDPQAGNTFDKSAAVEVTP